MKYRHKGRDRDVHKYIDTWTETDSDVHRDRVRDTREKTEVVFTKLLSEDVDGFVGSEGDHLPLPWSTLVQTRRSVKERSPLNDSRRRRVGRGLERRGRGKRRRGVAGKSRRTGEDFVWNGRLVRTPSIRTSRSS